MRAHHLEKACLKSPGGVLTAACAGKTQASSSIKSWALQDGRETGY
jgi:hypothetical protein